MGDSLCAYLSSECPSGALHATPGGASGRDPGSPAGLWASPGGWSVYSGRPAVGGGGTPQNDGGGGGAAGSPYYHAAAEEDVAAGARATPAAPLPCDDVDLSSAGRRRRDDGGVGSSGGGGGAAPGQARLQAQIVEMSAKLRGFASEWARRLEAMDQDAPAGAAAGQPLARAEQQWAAKSQAAAAAAFHHHQQQQHQQQPLSAHYRCSQDQDASPLGDAGTPASARGDAAAAALRRSTPTPFNGGADAGRWREAARASGGRQ
jgi:hypothetical protein